MIIDYIHDNPGMGYEWQLEGLLMDLLELNIPNLPGVLSNSLIPV